MSSQRSHKHPGRLLLTFLCLGLLSSSASAAGEAGVLTASYEATALPGKDGWTGQQWNGASMELTGEGLRIRQREESGWGESTRVFYCFPTAVARSLTVSARVRSLAASKPGAATLGICDGVREEYVTFFPDRIYLHRLNYTHRADMTSAARDVRIELSPGGLRLFLDGKHVFDAGDRLAATAMRTPMVSFGILSGGATGDSIWQNVTARLTPMPAAELNLPPPVTVLEKMDLFRKPGVFALFPDMLRGADNALYVRAPLRKTSSHLENVHDNVILRSTNEGKTWETTGSCPILPAFQTSPGHYVRVGAVGWRQSRDPALRAKLEADGIEVRVNPDNSGLFTYTGGYFINRSADNGRTWAREERGIPGMALLMNYHECLSTLRVNDQVLMRAIYGKPTAKKNYYESYVLLSEDNGDTWHPVRIFSDPRKTLSFGETALALAANGDIVAMLRQEPISPTSSLWVSRSSDHGRTWSTPAKTPMTGHPACLTPLRDGTLLCTYGHRSSPIGIRAALSRDCGKTWRAEDIRTVRDDGFGAGSGNGYPVTLETSDGDLFTACYLTDRQGVSYVAGTRWRWNP